MTPIWLNGSGLHTRLGRSGPDHSAQLKSGDASLLALPDPVKLELTDETVAAPYHLLDGQPLDALNVRLDNVLNAVVADALDSAGLDADARHNCGLWLGSSSGDIGLIEAAYSHALKTNINAQPLDWRCCMDNVAANLRAEFELGIEGLTVNTACTAAANALLLAQAALATNRVDHALVVGVETFNTTTALGFNSLDLLTRDAMRPFDARRNGLVLGEAVAAVVISREPNGARLSVLGGATLSDCHSISAANPDGSSIQAVMQMALDRAGVSAPEISAVKAHATASLLNDEGEAAGLKRLFGDAMPKLTTLKPYVGHTFGASGLAELLMLTACLDDGFWPGVPGVCETPGDLGIILPQSFSGPPDGPILLNQFGFGGNNTSLVVRHD